MPKIPVVSSKKFCMLLEVVGCTLKRVEGDHYIYVKDGLYRPIVVPIRKSLPEYVVFNNLRTLKMSREEFVSLLKKI